MKLSVIIPTCRENPKSFVKEMAQSYPKSNEIEYIVVDSGTDERVREHWRAAGFTVKALEDSNRAQRLQFGYNLSIGEIVIFHHPRSVLDESAFYWVIKNSSKLGWGGFTHKFDLDHWALRFTSFYSNRVRPRTGKVLYLDHCIYFRREYLDKPIPEIPIFEDTEISKILARHGSPRVLPFESITSAIRFETNGIFSQALMNQKMKLEYFWGKNRIKMNREYEKGLELNE